MTEHNWEDFVTSVREDPASAGFVLDFDGTLSGIAPTPAEARALPGASAVLATLAARYPLVAILSGRRAADVSRLIPAEGVRYLGLYGAEELPPRGLVAAPRNPSAGLVDESRAFLQREGLIGTDVEDKGHSVALHYRNATSPEAISARVPRNSMSPPGRSPAHQLAVQVWRVHLPAEVPFAHRLRAVVHGVRPQLAGGRRAACLALLDVGASGLAYGVRRIGHQKMPARIPQMIMTMRTAAHTSGMSRPSSG